MDFIFALFYLLFLDHIMRKTNSLFILLALIILCHSLHSKTNHNFETSDQQDLAYYESLNQKESDLKEALAEIKSNLNFLHQTLSQLEGQDQQQIITLEDALADERDVIYQLQ